MSPAAPILRVAVPSPLRRSFDYLPPPGCPGGKLLPGVRLRVPFGKRSPVGILLEICDNARVPGERLKPALELLDEAPLLPPDLLELLSWASAYYHEPPGEVLSAALPGLLRKGRAATVTSGQHWRISPAGLRADPAALSRAPRQAEMLRYLAAHPEGVTATRLSAEQPRSRDALHRLARRGWVEAAPEPTEPLLAAPTPGPALNPAQQAATARITGHLDGYAAYLLDGVTGSGKTEVYLNVIRQVIERGRQALVLVPEISLTPQTVVRLERRLGARAAVLHSSLSDQERLRAWLMARHGETSVVIGTRSAVFTPMRALGVIVVDEEHDLSFKQQEGFRYHARDVAVMRARQAGVPIVLGSATPSLESLHNAAQGRYAHLTLPERAGSAAHPSIGVIDLRRQPMETGISRALLEVVDAHLKQNEQVLLFLNRRGYAPMLICHACGWVAECQRCDARMTLHTTAAKLRCHHCGAERPIETRCPACGAAELRRLGQGTERIEEVLQERLPGVGIARIDRDSTRRKGAMSALLEEIRQGKHRVLIGTQMLTKGHHFPDVTLVGVLNADQGLFGTDFRSAERMAQLIVQVAGRAGRAAKRGRVLIQTHVPDHPLLQTLLSDGYAAFASRALEERRLAELPPFAALALLRAEAPAQAAPTAFLDAARAAAEALRPPGVQLWGPIPAPMERRAGRYRAQLMLQALHRTELQRLLGAWVDALEQLPSGRKVRWSLDVDPMETL